MNDKLKELREQRKEMRKVLEQLRENELRIMEEQRQEKFANGQFGISSNLAATALDYDTGIPERELRDYIANCQSFRVISEKLTQFNGVYGHKLKKFAQEHNLDYLVYFK